MKAILLCLSIFLSTIAFANNDGIKVVYGEDNRHEVYEASEINQALSRSTLAMISYDKISNIDDNNVQIIGPTLEERGICSFERFAYQPTSANCSGFLVGQDLLVTAGHCVRHIDDCRKNAWVLDFKVNKDEAGYILPKKNILGCKEIIKTTLDYTNKNDFAIIRLDRKAEDRTPLKFRISGKIQDNEDIFVIGHPTGLPTKVADGANVRENTNSIFFTANLDTFGGNSGSPVFNAKTSKVEGILVRGDADYIYSAVLGCSLVNTCENLGCRGEDVTRITNLSPILQKLLIKENLLFSIADILGKLSVKAN